MTDRSCAARCILWTSRLKVARYPVPLFSLTVISLFALLIYETKTSTSLLIIETMYTIMSKRFVKPFSSCVFAHDER
jgi:hypothetical protein